MLDFIEYLLEWSRTFPIFVITLSRPELGERRPNWGASKRSFTSLYLEPLADPAMHDLLSGLVPGLPEEVEVQILARAEGVPLYAVETVRMLLDRGLLRNEGSVYVPTGPIDSLDVPETLHALIAARLDVLSVEERRVVQDGAVLGKTFFKEGLVRLGSIEGEEMDAVLASLVRKEILTIQTDTRSPEYGQYGFLQDLLRTVAYETLSRHDRKAKHLEAASFVREIWPTDEDEIVDVLAAHYIRAYEAVPDAPDAPEIREQACQMLVRAGDRAASLAANGEALRHFEHAAELTGPGRERAELLQAGRSHGGSCGTLRRGRSASWRGAAKIFDAEGEPRKAAQARGRLALRVLTETGRQDEGIRIGKESFAILARRRAGRRPCGRRRQPRPRLVLPGRHGSRRRGERDGPHHRGGVVAPGRDLDRSQHEGLSLDEGRAERGGSGTPGQVDRDRGRERSPGTSLNRVRQSRRVAVPARPLLRGARSAPPGSCARPTHRQQATRVARTRRRSRSVR